MTETIIIKTSNVRSSSYYDKDSGALDINVVLGGHISVEGEVTLYPDKLNGGYSAGSVPNRDYWVAGKMLAQLEKLTERNITSVLHKIEALASRTARTERDADGSVDIENDAETEGV